MSLLPRRLLHHRSLGNADGRLPTSLLRHSHLSVADKAHHRSDLSRKDMATFNNRPQRTTDNGNHLHRGTCFEVRACNTDTDVLTFNTRSAKNEMSIAVIRPSSLSIYKNLQHLPTSWGHILESAKFAEAAVIAGTGADGNELSQLMEKVRASRADVQQLATSLDKMTSCSIHCRSPTLSRRISSRASLQQVTFAESPARRDHHRSLTSFEPCGDRYTYRGRGRPPCQQRDTSTALLQGRVRSSLKDGRGSAPHQPRHGDGTHDKLLTSSPW